MKQFASSAFCILRAEKHFAFAGPVAEQHKVKCDCCGVETLAKVSKDKLVIMNRRHGRKHIAVITLHELVERLNHSPKSS